MSAIKPIEAVEHSWSDTGIYEVNGRRIAMLTIRDEATEENQEQLEAKMSADARRLVACWNRLEPFTTEQIEDPGFDLTGAAVTAEEMRSFSVLHQKLQRRFNQLEEERDQLKSQRDQLQAELSALKEMQANTRLIAEDQRDKLLWALELLLCEVEEAIYMTGSERKSESRAVASAVIAQEKGGDQ